MQTWARRGLQTALVTGGLLMLGTGIASAGENVNPDRPASPIDGGASVPVHVGDNAVGTPAGQLRPATVDRTVSTGEMPREISTPAAGVANRANGPLHPLGANRVRGDLVVPVDVSGNAIAAGGNTTVTNHSDQSAGHTAPVLAGWAPGSPAGNAVEIEHAAPVQVTGNAVSIAGAATSFNDAGQSATTGGDTTTTGAGHTLAGNVLAEQGATPVQVDGNAVAGGGNARTFSTTHSAAASRGTVHTSGAHGAGSGNVGAVPVALPVEVTDQAVSGIGNADSAGRNTVTAQGGDRDRHGTGYVLTNGDPSALSGNAVVPAVANPAELTCNAASAIGNSDAECATTNTDTAGGPVHTTGVGSTGSGNLALVPVSEPAEVFGNGVSAAGTANSGASNTERSTALGNGFTFGDHSTLSGENATAPVAGANDVFANGVSAIGNAAGNDVRSTSGGYSGTTGDGGTGSGNIGQLPVAAPVEAYGSAGSVGGNATGTVPGETKTIRAGGSPNSDDDNGTASSNVVSAPTALPAQFFGDAAGVAANTGSDAGNATAVFAGGAPTATGRSGTGSGNIVYLPSASPAQVFADGASVIGNGHTTGTDDTTVWSGGTARADGSGGTAAGNVVTVPDAGPIQAFGVAAASPGNEEADSLDNTSTTAGADTVTNGARGALAGNVVTAPITQVEQVFAAGLAAAGNSTADGFDDTATTSGGNVRTSGEWGALSGDLVGIPATDVTRAASDGVAALGNQRAFSHHTTSAVSGGTARTAGNGPLDGTPLMIPLPVNATVFRVPVEVLGRAVDNGYQRVIVDDGDTAPRIDLPFGQQAEFGPSDAVDDLLRADQVPALGGIARPRRPMPTMDMTQVFTVLSDGVPGLSTMEMTQQMPALRPAPQNLPTPRNTPYDPAPAYQPMTGQLPVPGGNRGPVASANLPTVNNSVPRGAAGLPDLPPVPTLPAMPPLRGGPSFTPHDDGPVTQQLPITPGLPQAPRLQAPQVSAPSLPRFQPPRVTGPLTGTRPSTQDLPLPVQTPRFSTPPLQAPELTGPITGAGPATQDVPAGAAQQLMAQLRGLISELENSGSSGGVHPLDVRTPGRMEPPAL